MSTLGDCCQPCPTVQTVMIPGATGAAGAAGTPGTNGINAFTITTANFVVPAIGGNVTVSLSNGSWMVAGQNVYIQNAGYFSVSSVAGSTSAVLTYLNYSGNTNTGNTVTAGAGVTPAGTQGPNSSLLPAVTSYAVGGSQALSGSFAQILSTSITLAAKSYLLLATLRLDFDVATFSSSQQVTMKLRETLHGPADIANAIVNAKTGVTTLASSTWIELTTPPVVYSATAGDVIQIYGIVAATPYSGALRAVEASLMALPLF